MVQAKYYDGASGSVQTRDVDLAPLGIAPDETVPCGFRPNLAAIIPGEDTERTFWIISHVDVVPAGDLRHDAAVGAVQRYLARDHA